MRVANAVVMTALFLCLACGREQLNRAESSFVVTDEAGVALVSLQFDSTDLGSTQLRRVRVVNTGNSAIDVESESTTSEFTLVPSAFTLAAGAAQDVDVAFAPTTERPFVGLLRWVSGSIAVSVQVSGTGRRPPLIPDAGLQCAISVRSPSNLGVVPRARATPFRFVVEGTNCPPVHPAYAAGTDPAFRLLDWSVPLQSGEIGALDGELFPIRYGDYSATIEFLLGSQRIQARVSASVVDPCAKDAGLCEFPAAVEPVYLNTDDSLFTFDPAAGTTARVGVFSSLDGPPPILVDIAVLPDGGMYGVTGSDLLRVNPETAVTAYVAPLELGKVVGLGVTSSGELIAAGNGLFVIDERTGEPTRTIVATSNPSTAGDVAQLGDQLYWSVPNATTLTAVSLDGGMISVTNIPSDNAFGLATWDGGLLIASPSGNVFQRDEAGKTINAWPLLEPWNGAATGAAH